MFILKVIFSIFSSGKQEEFDEVKEEEKPALSEPAAGKSKRYFRLQLFEH